MMRAIWDGLMSLLAAALTGVLTLGPAWFTHLAVGAGVAPAWAYAVIAGTVAVGLLMITSFLKKAARGIAPLRERRR